VPNLLIGLTPWIDNWMHLGGLVVGAAVTALMLPELRA
jgi:membrane associated rhomboid family serine protease